MGLLSGNILFYTIIVLFFLFYFLIVTERYHRTITAIFGGVIMILVGAFSVRHSVEISSQEIALSYVDFNTLGLLIGMMIIIFVLKQTKLFQYLAIQAVRWAKGCPLMVMVYLAIITAVSSAFLDNVTTVMLITPITFAIAYDYKISPMPFLITGILASNIGGAATLIGDPPNILIGSVGKYLNESGEMVRLGFNDFLFNMGPISIICFIVVICLLTFLYKEQLVVSEEIKNKFRNRDTSGIIKNKPLLFRSLFVLGIVIVGFVTHNVTHIDLATIALFGAGLLLLLTHHDDDVELEESLEKVEWVVIFFFMGLFVMVGALEEIGVISNVADWLISKTKGDLFSETFSVLWGSAIFSSFVDNIPFVVTMIPVVENIGEIHPEHLESLWWALAIGACFGGNGSLIGASANLVVAGIAEKSGTKIRFLEFLKIGFPVMILTMTIASFYVWFRYI